MATIEAPQAQAKGGGLAVAGLPVGFVLMWSSGFVGGRLGTQPASTLTLMSWRFLAILPIAVLLLALLARRAGGLSPRRWLRQAVGGDLAGGSAPAWAYALPFAGMLGLVAATLVEARDPEPIPIVEGLAVQCATSAVAFTLLAAAAGRLADPVVAEPAFWGAAAWLIAFSTLGGYGFYWLTMRRAGATRLSSLVYLTPPTTAVWAWLMFGDELTPAAIAGFAVCLLGVAVVFGPTRRRNRRA